MIADKITIQDGQTYKPGDEIPDLGSIEAIGANGSKRKYHAFSKDADKLPHYVSGGSTCFMLDTLDLYQYHEKTDTWQKLEG